MPLKNIQSLIARRLWKRFLLKEKYFFVNSTLFYFNFTHSLPEYKKIFHRKGRFFVLGGFFMPLASLIFHSEVLEYSQKKLIFAALWVNNRYYTWRFFSGGIDELWCCLNSWIWTGFYLKGTLRMGMKQLNSKNNLKN